MIKNSEIGEQFVIRVWCEDGKSTEDSIRGSIHCVGADQTTFFVGFHQLSNVIPRSVRARLLGPTPE